MTDQSPSPELNPIKLPEGHTEPVLYTGTQDLIPAPTAQEIADDIKEQSTDATALANAVAKVDLAFPAIGFIDPTVQLEKMRRLSQEMDEGARRAYPEAIRAKLLAYHAAPQTAPAVSDDELALAIFIRRTTDTTLTVEEVEAKTTGKIKKDPAAPKAPRKNAKPKQATLDDLLGGA